MRAKTTVPPVSIRRAALHPSERYADPVASSKALRTNWRLGIDGAPHYRSTAFDSSAEAASVPPEVLALRQPRIEKNASSKDAIQGEQSRYDPAQTFATSYSGQFTLGASACASNYRRQAPQFDRAGANKTNYSLATSPNHYDLRATSHAHHADPASWEVRPEFEPPVVGGWCKPGTGAYVQDEYSRHSIRRGGGGGEGSLGVRFNIITNADAPRARDDTKLRTGPRVSCNVKDPWRQGANRFGAMPGGQTIDIVSGRLKQPHRAPYAPTPADLRRPDEPILRSRPW